jgi:hypothetical protein
MSSCISNSPSSKHAPGEQEQPETRGQGVEYYQYEDLQASSNTMPIGTERVSATANSFAEARQQHASHNNMQIDKATPPEDYSE